VAGLVVFADGVPFHKHFFLEHRASGFARRAPPESLWNRRGKPALKAAGITKKVCYHTFRHTFGTLLNASGENPKVVQELLRHANLKVTTDTYMQALAPEKRRAQSKLITMVRGRKATA
jgi:integrase